MGRLAPPGYPKMYSTPSRSSASSTMSAPVNWSLLIWSRNEEAPAFRSGAFAIYFAVWLARACPRLDANKAQESKQRYEQAGRAGHVNHDVNEPGGGPG